MKRFLAMAFAALLLVVLVGCAQNDVGSEPMEQQIIEYQHESESSIFASPVSPRFNSLEEFLSIYMSVQERGSTDKLSEHVVERVNLTTLDGLYLPSNIPDGFGFFQMSMDQEFVTIWYLPEKYLMALDTEEGILAAYDARNHGRSFAFNFTRGWGANAPCGNPMAGIIEQRTDPWLALTPVYELEWVNDKYLVDGNMITFSSGNEVITITMPLVSDGGRAVESWDFVMMENDVLHYAQFETLDLADTAAVQAKIAELAAE